MNLFSNGGKRTFGWQKNALCELALSNILKASRKIGSLGTLGRTQRPTRNSTFCTLCELQLGRHLSPFSPLRRQHLSTGQPIATQCSDRI